MIAMRRAALVAIAAGTLLATASAVAAQDASSTPAAAADPVLAFREPAEGASIVGEVTIAVKLTPPDAAGVEVVITVDGRELCTRQKPPFSCTWDAGPEMREHHLRAVATLGDGRRLVANRHTPGLDVNETVEVAAVQVPVVVTDAHGRFVRGLKKESFRLLENGKPQRIETLTDDSLPLELIATVDISASMERAMPRVQAAVKGLLSRLRQGDTTTLLGFNDSVFVLAERESDAALREAAVDALVPWGGTAFFDATVRSLELVGQKPGRRGIIIFSDGDDRHSVGRRDESLRRIEEGQVVIYTIGFGDGASTQFRETLKAFAEASGGRAYFPRRTEDLDAAFGSILDELSHQYILSYVSGSPPDGSWRTLEIHACDGCVVRAREGYRAAER